jgi:anti-anti-sigma factor
VSELTLERRDGLLLARLEGEIDLANAPRIEAAIVGAADGADRIVVVAEDVTYFDSSGMRMLDGLVGVSDAAGVALRVVAPDPCAVRFILKMCGWRPELLAQTLDDALTA